MSKHSHIPGVANMAQRASEYSRMMGLTSGHSSPAYYGEQHKDILAHHSNHPVVKRAKGGRIGDKVHPLSHDQRDMHMPHLMEEKKKISVPHYARGGHHEMHEGRHHEMHGGKVHSKRKPEKKGLGGLIGGGLGTLAGGLLGGPTGAAIGSGLGGGIGNWAQDELHRAGLFKEGGHAHKSHMHKVHKRAAGGLLSPSHVPMVGEEGGHHPSLRHGGHAKKKALGGPMLGANPSTWSPQGRMEGNNTASWSPQGRCATGYAPSPNLEMMGTSPSGTALRHGGRATAKHHMAHRCHGGRNSYEDGGQVIKRAKGGVGKIRLGVMSPNGRPITPPSSSHHVALGFKPRKGHM